MEEEEGVGRKRRRRPKGQVDTYRENELDFIPSAGPFEPPYSSNSIKRQRLGVCCSPFVIGWSGLEEGEVWDPGYQKGPLDDFGKHSGFRFVAPEKDGRGERSSECPMRVPQPSLGVERWLLLASKLERRWRGLCRALQSSASLLTGPTVR